MKGNQSLFLLFLWLLIFSCKKDDVTIPITYPSVYNKSGIRTNGVMRVFSTSGEITDPSVISLYNQKDSSTYSWVARTILNLPWMDSIKFSDAQRAIVNDRFYSANCLVNLESGRLILTRTDTSKGELYGDEFTRSMDYIIGGVKPEVYNEYLISSTGGNYRFGYSAREKFVLKETGGQLVAPFIQFTGHREQLILGYINYDPGYVNNTL